MKRNGFTLIEIIICIVLITIIGTASFVGIKTMKNNIRINKLEQITDKSLLAAQLYIENNKDAYNQLYKEQNGVVIPIKLLVNEGLLSLDNTDLTDSDIENEYVISALSTTTPGGTDCTEINETTSWSSDAPIYLCINSATGSSNLSIIDPTKISNSTNTSRERFYYSGMDALNWVSYNNKKYRIYYVDTDDSLALYTTNPDGKGFDGAFNGLTQPITSTRASCYFECPLVNQNPTVGRNSYSNIDTGSYTTSEGETNINCYDVMKTSKCYIEAPGEVHTYNSLYSYGLDGWMKFNWDYSGNSSANPTYIVIYSTRISRVYYYPVKIRLKSCMKITSGTGDFSTPYILENKCS